MVKINYLMRFDFNEFHRIFIIIRKHVECIEWYIFVCLFHTKQRIHIASIQAILGKWQLPIKYINHNNSMLI